MKKRNLREDKEGDFAYVAGLGLLIIIVILVVPSFLYDSAGDTWNNVKEDTVSAGTSVRFTGEVSSLRRDTTLTGLGYLKVKDFKAPIYFRNSDIEVGDEVTVSGKYFGATVSETSLGFVCGGHSVLTPADVSHPWWKTGICNTVFLIAIIMIIVGAIGMFAG